MRVSKLTHLYRDKVPLRDLMAMSGHSSLKSLQEYLKVDIVSVLDQ